MSGPFISVIIPTFNRPQQTVAAVESVLAQTFAPGEIIVVDDGSTDDTGDVIQCLAGRVKAQGTSIYYFHQDNQGPSVARNLGIERARGEYIAFLDSDDTWLPDKLEWQLRAIEQYKDECGACLTDTALVTDSGADTTTFRVYGRNYAQTTGIVTDALASLAKAFCGFWISSLLVRTSLVKQIHGFDPQVKFAEDRDFFFALALATPIAFVNKPLVHTDRRSSAHVPSCRPWEKTEVQLLGQQLMLEKWLSMDVEMAPGILRAIRRNLLAVHSAWANWHLARRQYGEARQEVALAMKYEFTPGVAMKCVLCWVAPAIAKRLSGKFKPYL